MTENKKIKRISKKCPFTRTWCLKEECALYTENEICSLKTELITKTTEKLKSELNLEKYYRLANWLYAEYNFDMSPRRNRGTRRTSNHYRMWEIFRRELVKMVF